MVAAGISHFLTHSYKISMFFFQRNWSPLFFLSLVLTLSQLSRSMKTLKFCRRIESALLFALLLSLFFLSLKARVARRFTAETCGCLKCKISPRIDP